MILSNLRKNDERYNLDYDANTISLNTTADKILKQLKYSDTIYYGIDRNASYNVDYCAARPIFLNGQNQLVATANSLVRVWHITEDNGNKIIEIITYTLGNDGWTVTKEEISGGSGAAVQSDWNQNDDTAPDYIKNKPNLNDFEHPIVMFLSDGEYAVTFSAIPFYWAQTDIVTQVNGFITQLNTQYGLDIPAYVGILSLKPITNYVNNLDNVYNGIKIMWNSFLLEQSMYFSNGASIQKIYSNNDREIMSPYMYINFDLDNNIFGYKVQGLQISNGSLNIIDIFDSNNLEGLAIVIPYYED